MEVITFDVVTLISLLKSNTQSMKELKARHHNKKLFGTICIERVPYVS